MCVPAPDQLDLIAKERKAYQNSNLEVNMYVEIKFSLIINNSGVVHRDKDRYYFHY